MKLIATLLLALFLTNCSSTKTTTAITETKNTMEGEKKMIENGFLAGEIVASTKENDCPFAIEVGGADGVYYLDGINLEEEYKKGGEKIWFKFTPLRMMNRCDKANPITITEIQRRAE